MLVPPSAEAAPDRPDYLAPANRDGGGDGAGKTRLERPPAPANRPRPRAVDAMPPSTPPTGPAPGTLPDSALNQGTAMRASETAGDRTGAEAIPADEASFEAAPAEAARTDPAAVSAPAAARGDGAAESMNRSPRDRGAQRDGSSASSALIPNGRGAGGYRREPGARVRRLHGRMAAQGRAHRQPELPGGSGAAGAVRPPAPRSRLNPDGAIEDIALRRSSGQPVLDDAAVRIVQLAAPFARFPRASRRRWTSSTSNAPGSSTRATASPAPEGSARRTVSLPGPWPAADRGGASLCGGPPRKRHGTPERKGGLIREGARGDVAHGMTPPCHPGRGHPDRPASHPGRRIRSRRRAVPPVAGHVCESACRRHAPCHNGPHGSDQPVPHRDAEPRRSELSPDGDPDVRAQRGRRDGHRHQPAARHQAHRGPRPHEHRDYRARHRSDPGAPGRAGAARARIRHPPPAGGLGCGAQDRGRDRYCDIEGHSLGGCGGTRPGAYRHRPRLRRLGGGPARARAAAERMAERAGGRPHHLRHPYEDRWASAARLLGIEPHHLSGDAGHA